MSDKIRRVFVEKKKEYAVEAAGLCSISSRPWG